MSEMRRAEMTRGMMCAAMIVTTHSPTCPASSSTERRAAPGHRTQRRGRVCSGHQVSRQKTKKGFNFVSIFSSLSMFRTCLPTLLLYFTSSEQWRYCANSSLALPPLPISGGKSLPLDLDYYRLFADDHLSLSI